MTTETWRQWVERIARDTGRTLDEVLAMTLAKVREEKDRCPPTR